MNITLHDSEIIDITGHRSDADDIRNHITMERVKFEHKTGELTIWLTPEQADKLHAALDVLFPPIGAGTPADPTPTHPERDAAPTLDVCDVLAADRAMDDAITAADEEALAAIRPPGVSKCAATVDTMDDLLAPVHEALAAKYHAQTIDFVTRKLGL